jgi:4-hydroxybenzoate polyprenyltransferase
MAGMALNDYADRRIDQVDRPSRPIPAGRVDPRLALGLATGLSAAGVGLAGMVGGGRSLSVMAPLAASVWGYDLILKETVVGPGVMATCRFLDVLMGAAHGKVSRAIRPAGLVALHTLVVSMVSRKEAVGGMSGPAIAAACGTAGVATLAGIWVQHAGKDRERGPLRRYALLVLGVYAANLGWKEWHAAREPSPTNLQQVVGAAVLGLMLLEAALLLAARAPRGAVALGAGWLVARRLARRRSVT